MDNIKSKTKLLREFVLRARGEECPPIYGIDCIASKTYCQRRLCWHSTILELTEEIVEDVEKMENNTNTTK